MKVLPPSMTVVTPSYHLSLSCKHRHTDARARSSSLGSMTVYLLPGSQWSDSWLTMKERLASVVQNEEFFIFTVGELPKLRFRFQKTQNSQQSITHHLYSIMYINFMQNNHLTSKYSYFSLKHHIII